MKKLLFIIMLIGGFSSFCMADNLTDPFTFLQGNAVLAITQHGSVSFEYGERGSKNISLLDNVVEIGRLKKSYLIGVDAGIDGAALPQTGATALSWSAGAKVNLNSVVNNLATVAPEWSFLKSFEYSVRYAYESSLRHPRWTVALAYGFGPATPK